MILFLFVAACLFILHLAGESTARIERLRIENENRRQKCRH